MANQNEGPNGASRDFSCFVEGRNGQDYIEDKKILCEIQSKAHNALILSLGDEVLKKSPKK